MKMSCCSFVAVLACVGCGGQMEDSGDEQEQQHIHAVIGEASTAPTGTGNLNDHGGTVIPGLHYYLIFWGTGFESTTPALYSAFLGGLAQSKYWTIDTQYLRGAANTAAFVKAVVDPSSPTAHVTDASLQGEVHKVLLSGALGAFDSKGLYFVVTPRTSQVCYGPYCSCTQFCGYHSRYSDSKFGSVLYSSIPSAAACPTACGVFANDASAPNRNVEADEGVSVLAHEAEETQSDALGNGWYDSQGSENADKCAYKYGPTTLLNGAHVNQRWGGTGWLVQMNWSNKISGCAQQGPTDGPYAR